MSTTQNGTGRLSRCLAAAADAEDVSQSGLTVLSSSIDPYRLDNVTGHRYGSWFAAQVYRFLPAGAAIHLRGLHYAVASTGFILDPEGKAYANTDRNWVLLCRAAKAARWLRYVPFGRIKDERNQKPEIFVPETEPGSVALYSGQAVDVPTLEQAMPEFCCAGLPSQPYRVILVGEKSSLSSVLLPIAQRIGGELLLPTGEASDTMIAELAARAVGDGRPAVVLYFSDFDPAGHQMPVSFARKLQAVRDLEYDDLDIQVHPVALTVSLGLPSTPLKETERRADRWRTVHGHEQTEIARLRHCVPTCCVK